MTLRRRRDLPSLLLEAGSTVPDRVAWHLSDGRLVSYAAFAADMERAARLIAGVVDRGEVVMVEAAAAVWPEFAAAYLGAQLAGAVPAPFDASMPVARRNAWISQLRTRVVLGTRGQPLEELPPSVRHVDTTAEEAGADCAVDARVREDAVAEVQLTSGVTGRPKAVAATHREILDATLGPPRSWAGKTIAHTIAPATALGTQGALLLQIRAAMTAAAPVLFLPAHTRALYAEARPEVTLTTPAAATALLRHGALDGPAAETLRYILLSGAAAEPHLFRRLAAAVPRGHILSLYGLTEAGGAQIVLTFDAERRTVCGRPSGTMEVEIRTGDGRAADVGTTGEIWLRRLGVPPRRYLADEEATAQVFVDGWTRTGDLGRIDKEGYLEVVGREKDIAIVAGRNVSLGDVAATVGDHAAVDEAVALGVADERQGERIVLFVVGDSGRLQTTWRSWCARRLAPHELPSELLFVDAIPRTLLGKVDRGALVELLESP